VVQNLSGVKNFLQTVFTNTREVFAPQENTKDSLRLLARVLKVDSNNIVLWSDKGRLTGKVETPVFKGEHLLLEFSGLKEGRLHYRILARSGLPQESTEGQNTGETRQPSLWSFLVSPAPGFSAYPVLVRYNPYAGDEPAFFEESSEVQRRSILEFIVETRNLGLVMIKLQLLDENVHCTFLVEEERAGRALEEEALYSLGEGQEKEAVSLNLIEWKVYPVREELLRSAPKGNFSLNQKA